MHSYRLRGRFVPINAWIKKEKLLNKHPRHPAEATGKIGTEWTESKQKAALLQERNEAAHAAGQRDFRGRSQKLFLEKNKTLGISQPS